MEGWLAGFWHYKNTTSRGNIYLEKSCLLYTSKVILHHPDFYRRFFINCDASDVSLGGELYQESDEGDHLVISFASRVLNQSEHNYNVTEKELLSVVFACNKFWTYILGYPITVRSDHKSISFLQRCKLSHGRLTCLLYTSQLSDTKTALNKAKQ